MEELFPDAMYRELGTLTPPCSCRHQSGQDFVLPIRRSEAKWLARGHYRGWNWLADEQRHSGLSVSLLLALSANGDRLRFVPKWVRHKHDCHYHARD